MPISFDLVGQQWQRKAIVVAAVAVGTVLLMTMRPVSPEGAYWHETVERTGMILILIGILGRTWCTLYIGGNKLSRLVTDGPYSVTRNPLYLFSVICAFGVGAQLGSAVFALLCAAVTTAIFVLVISHEERALTQLFPGEFNAYKATVPRLIPALSRWQDAETLLVRPALVHRTFRDAMLFVVAAAGLKGLESLRDSGAIAPLFQLY
jgi:protein-S-isoprenylcysteine O-methyltransferase Ste14